MDRRTRAAYLGPARRRDSVLDAALTVFSRGGFAAASMAAVAAEAGVAKAVVYDCFPGGKQELYYALLDQQERQFVTYLTERWTGLGRGRADLGIRAGLDAFLGYAEVNPRAFGVIFGQPGAGDPDIRERAAAVRRSIVDRLTDGAMRALALPPELRPHVELNTRLVVACAEEIARWQAEGAPLDRDELADLAARFILQGLGPAFAEPDEGRAREDDGS